MSLVNDSLLWDERCPLKPISIPSFWGGGGIFAKKYLHKEPNLFGQQAQQQYTKYKSDL